MSKEVKKKKQEHPVIKVFNGGGWIYGSKASSFEEADVVVLPGGGDWNPALYGHKKAGTNYYSEDTDNEQMRLINKAINAGKLVFGICRGLQGVTIRNGGFLIQDVNHPSRHIVKTKDGVEYGMNSCHHQMCYPYNLPKDSYEVIAWTPELSNHYQVDREKVELDFPEYTLDEEGNFKEPEMIWYPKTKCLGVQGHPEWGPGAPALDYINKVIREKLGK